MLEYVLSHLAQTLVVVGLILLAIEVLVLGFATFILFYIGCASILTGTFIGLDILPNDPSMASVSLAVLSLIIAMISWKPLKAMQSSVDSSTPANDMIGHRFMLPQDITHNSTIVMRYSGIDWVVRSDQPILLGLEVEIVTVSVGQLKVKVVE